VWILYFITMKVNTWNCLKNYLGSLKKVMNITEWHLKRIYKTPQSRSRMRHMYSLIFFFHRQTHQKNACKSYKWAGWDTVSRLLKIMSTHSAVPAFRGYVFVSKIAYMFFWFSSGFTGFLLCKSTNFSTHAARSPSWLIIRISHIFWHNRMKCLEGKDASILTF